MSTSRQELIVKLLELANKIKVEVKRDCQKQLP
jgi:hypothetical protein